MSSSYDWSVCVIDVETGEPLTQINVDQVHRTASVGKLFLLIEVARQLEAGSLDPAELVDRRTEVTVADSGVWHTMDADALTLDDACRLIGAVSDNLATNVLIGRIGIDAIAETSKALGFERSVLLDRIRAERLPEHAETLSQGTAGELADLCARLAKSSVISAEVSQRVLDWISLNTDLSMVAAAFGLDPLAHIEEDRGITLRNKTGTISTARIDVGVIRGPARTLAYAVLANWADDAPDDTRDAVLAAMRQVGEELLTLVRGTPPASAGR